MLIQRKKGRLNADFKLADVYKYYCTYAKKPIDYKLFRKICLITNRKVVKEMITNNMMFILPFRTGNIVIRKYKIKLRERISDSGLVILNQAVDWKATKELWKEEPDIKSRKVIYIDNEHSKGQSFKFIYNTFNANFKNKFLVGFKPLRKVSRALASEIINNPDYDAYEK